MTNLLKKESLIIMLGLSLVGVLFVGSVFAAGGYGAEGAGSDEEYTLEEMLIYAIQDEYLARAEYEAIMEEYGEQRPFSNIIQAETNHIQELLPLFEEHGIEVPEDTSNEHLVIPESLEEIFAIGVDAEIANIAMYEKFLNQDLPEDVAEVFVNLKEGSEKHQTAFERGLDRGAGRGRMVNNTEENTVWGRNGRTDSFTRAEAMKKDNGRVSISGGRGRNVKRAPGESFNKPYLNQNLNNKDDCDCDCE